MKVAAQIPLREQEGCDDAHRLLGVVAAMTERVERGRAELQDAKGAVDREWILPQRRPTTIRYGGEREQEPDEWRDDDRDHCLGHSAPYDGPASGGRQAGADHPADQRMRAARR